MKNPAASALIAIYRKPLPISSYCFETDQNLGPAQRGCVQLMLERVGVLVVDDEPDSRALVKRLLEQSDATAVLAGSVNEAIGMLDGGGRFGVIVSDIGMPERDGFLTTRK